MLKKRIIPIVLIDGFSVLKTKRFKDRRNLGSPITVVLTYEARDVDELIILDIDASKQGRTVDPWLISDITDECFMPLSVGGGIKTCKDVEQLLRNGADKIVLNTLLFEDLGEVERMILEFGSQCISASLDFQEMDGSPWLINSGVVRNDLDPGEFIQRVEDTGVGELIITDVDREGAMQGCRLDLFKSIASHVQHVPLVAHGGVGNPCDVADLLAAPEIDAVAAASIFHFTEHTPKDCALRSKQREVSVRV